MSDPLSISSYKLSTFLGCKRRFQLRFVDRLPWPELPVGTQTERSVELGQQFHQLLQRHFMGLEVSADRIPDTEVRQWWQAFVSQGVALPAGRLLPEQGITMPVGRHLLVGRFDLLILGEEAGRPWVHIFDWKTGRLQSESELRQSWQTRVYAALLTEGSGALLPAGTGILPEHITITYWFVTQPDAPVTIRYNQGWHRHNWNDIQAMVQQIGDMLDEEQWPLTTDHNRCRDCAYQAFCGRQAAGRRLGEPAVEYEVEPAGLQLEPELP